MKRTPGSEQYIEKIKPVMRKMKFSDLTIDAVAKYMDISKATLYKHFSSKDEIAVLVINDYIDYLESGDVFVRDDTVSYSERFRKIFEQSLKCVIYASDVLLADLKETSPDLYDALMQAEYSRNKSMEVFLQKGMDDGVFNRLNAALFMVQDDAVIRRILDPKFSITYDLTLKQALMDYYRMKKYQLIAPAHIESEPKDENALEKRIMEILQILF
ncbi:TetR/AcrR family transcriptional regulator [Saccharibacillus sp. CPCC 101409]|uniref:TetR/AcrR family transcriptional regulator n=1 Tax=Saccharibacillus sp. CPCC 101409 TaxID=3058041 RepID=UPI00267399DA|nr:TetR/AcrR family transcriptional regulator [Saccharibacillus sp. CPCC 101409]MDO3411426.1 TetR/AcrR family transcriptional regulator [Saccharibacillus sp. CPCC 101409]